MERVTLFSKRDYDLIMEGINKVLSHREHQIIVEDMKKDKDIDRIHILNKDIAYLRLLILKIEKYLK